MSTLFSRIPERLLRTLWEEDRFLIIGHRQPDADCIFSSLTLKEILSYMGKEAVLLSEGPFLRQEIIPYRNQFHSSVSKENLSGDPAVIVVDCSTEDRPGVMMADLSGLPLIVIDHHIGGEPFAEPDMTYIIPRVPSTTLLVDEIRRQLDVPLTKKTAEYIYLGFATDTNFFSRLIDEHNGPETLERVADLLRTGISVQDIFEKLHGGKPFSYYTDFTRLLERTVSLCGGRLLYTYMKKGELTGEKPIEPLYSALLEVQNVSVIAIFDEKEEGTQVGLRSTISSGINVGKEACRLGGGGHSHQAGVTVSCGLEEAQKLVLPLLISLIENK